MEKFWSHIYDERYAWHGFVLRCLRCGLKCSVCSIAEIYRHEMSKR